MTAGIFAMAVATVGLGGLAASLLAGAALPATDRAAERLTPAHATWLWRAMAFAPLVFAFAVLSTVFWLVPCHCVVHGGHHPHLCLDHPTAWPTVGLALLAGGFAARGALAVARAGWHARRSQRVRERLESVSVTHDDGVRRVPGSSPWAVTLGLFRPRIFVAEALGSDSDAHIVLEHERVHATGRHELWQRCVSVAAALHLPGIGSAIARRMSIAQEMAADEAAARAVGDRSRVAAALVRLAREANAASSAGIAFASSPLELRVQSLLSGARTGGSDRKMAWWMLATGLLGASAIAMHASALHHALETLFGHLG